MRATGLCCGEFVGNSLLNMYGKCGGVEEAREFFESMTHRNVISWSTMVAAYAQRGDHDQALVLFQKMEEEGVEPNEVTFLSVLDACANAEAVEQGEMIHRLAARKKLDVGLIVGTALVGMYGKCSRLIEARQVFDGIVEKDVVTWSTMISAYAQLGHVREAIQLFGYMNLDGVRPNEIILMSILGACSSAGALAEGKMTHELVVICGFGADVSTGNTLIKMYGKCGDLASAKAVFGGMERRDLISWSAMLAVIAEHGHCKDAFVHFRRMDLEGVKPDYVTFVSLLDACSLLGALVEGNVIHTRIRAEGFQSVMYIENSLIDMYGKCGSLQAARGIFDRMSHRNVITWTTMITACVQHEQGKEALELFEEMEKAGVAPNAVTLVAALDACCISGALDAGREIHARISASGIETDRILTSLVDMYGKCGSLEDARTVFEKIKGRRCVPAWNAIIRAHAENGHGQVLQHYRRMNLEGLTPDDITFTTVLTSWSDFGNLNEVKEVHHQLRAGGYESDLILATALVHIYGKLKSLEDARFLFDRTANKDVVIWNAMLGAYASQGLGKDALELYSEMDLAPNDTTFISVLEACASTGSIHKGRAVYSRITEAGFDSNVQVATSLVYMFGKCGKPEEARLVFDKMREKTVVSWTAMVAAYAQQGHGAQALELFQEMDLEGVQPDQVAFLSIIHSCSHSGLVEEGRIYFLKMVEDQSFTPGVEHFVGMLDLLGRSGKLNEAEELMEFMPVEPGVVGWNTLLSACKTHNDTERAGRVAGGMLVLGPGHAGPYVSFSNILSGKG
ncbi:pentatricopeptide repeat-containing protein At3g09040, mitochondrial isoform X2 [Selaginella moellendorffii]|nr:pentatricopeptide repeat-containing protein At3g09040, mitochondrial isoform X2 [Selaginella moellendorffii]|eukprot:XP_024526596.1 pentatricopeptide repeat-containing protein At3g09040, mitochondrial isoform X2 [Selaginella moellendorffii]